MNLIGWTEKLALYVDWQGGNTLGKPLIFEFWWVKNCNWNLAPHVYDSFKLICYVYSVLSTRSHYRWVWATMWLLGIELRTSRTAVSSLNLWAISPALNYFLWLSMPIFSLSLAFKHILKVFCTYLEFFFWPKPGFPKHLQCSLTRRSKAPLCLLRAQPHAGR